MSSAHTQYAVYEYEYMTYTYGVKLIGVLIQKMVINLVLIKKLFLIKSQYEG